MSFYGLDGFANEMAHLTGKGRCHQQSEMVQSRGAIAFRIARIAWWTPLLGQRGQSRVFESKFFSQLRTTVKTYFKTWWPEKKLSTIKH